MNHKFLQLRTVFISFLLLFFFVCNTLAQFPDIEKTNKELTVRNIYTIIETKPRKTGINSASHELNQSKTPHSSPIEVSGTHNSSQTSDIFAGTWGAGIWKSTDMGNTWNRTSEGLLSYDIRKLVASNNSNRIFAATAKGLYYTNNDGLSWSAVNQLDEKVGYRNIIINGNDIYVAADDGKLYKSQNDGLTWSQTGKIDEPVITIPILILENKMLVGTENGLLISEDEGRTWTKGNYEINNETIKDISLINEILYITTLSKGIFISADYGNTISRFDNGLLQKRIKKVSSEAKENVFATVPIALQDRHNLISGLEELATSVEFISSNRNGKMSAITSGGKVLFSNDSGANWAVGSQLISAIPNTHIVGIKASDKIVKSYTPPPAKFLQNKLNKTTTAKINVTYNGFTSQARAAFQYAIDILASIISSPVEINVEATWAPLEGWLGYAGFTTSYTGFKNQPIPQTYYAVALAEKISGTGLNLPINPDIYANLNSDYSEEWYFGTDGNTPANQYDFVTVVLHELCHGLGYLSGFSYENSVGSWWDQYPYIYDRFLFNGSSGQALINFSNNSIELGAQLTNNNIYWRSHNVSNAKMYAPATWAAGSSISHLDDAIGSNELMAPFSYLGDVTHSPGIALDQMLDMGWGFVPDIKVAILKNYIVKPNDIVKVSVQAIEDLTEKNVKSFSFVLRYNKRILSVRDVSLTGTLSNMLSISTGIPTPGELVVNVTNDAGTPLTGIGSLVDINFIGLRGDSCGTHLILESFIFNSDGPNAITENGYCEIFGRCGEEPPYVTTDQSTRVYQNNPNPIQEGYESTIQYRIHVAGETNLTVYDILGREVTKLVNEYKPSGVYSVNFNTKGLSSGVYFYKLRAPGYEGLKKMVVIK